MKKVLLILSVFSLVLLAALELYIQSDAFAVKIRPYVIEPVQAVLGPHAQIGWIRANLIPTYLEVRDISIPDSHGKQMVAVRKIKVNINPLPLIFRKVRLPSIDVLEPRILAERSPEGEVNILTLIDQIRSNIARMQTGGQPRFELILRTVKIRNARLSFTDLASSAQLSISDINIVARINMAAKSAKIAFNNSSVHLTTPAYPEVSGKVRAVMGYDHGSLRLDSFELSTADATLTASGYAGPFPDANLNIKLRVRSGPQTIGKFANFMRPLRKSKQPEPRIDAAATIQGKLSAPEISGTCKFNVIPFRDYLLQNASVSFVYRNKNMSITGTGWKLSRGDKTALIESINASVAYENQGFNINHFDVHAGDLTVQLTGRADTSRGFDSALTVESSGKNKTLSFITNLPLEGRMGITGNLTGPFTDPVFDGTCTAGPVTIRGITFSSIEGRLRYRKKIISLVSADIHQQTSRYVLDGSVDLQGKEPVFDARLKVLRSDVVSIVKMFYGPLPLQLNTTGDLTFNGTIHEYAGSGRLEFDSGSAYGESFTKGTVAISLTTNKISFPQVIVHKGSGTVKASGWIGFDGTYSANLDSQNIRLSEIDHMVSLPIDGQFGLNVSSSGSFAHPRLMASMEINHLLYRQEDIGKVLTGVQISNGVLMFTSWLSGDRAGVTARLTLHQPYEWSAEAKVHSDAIDPFQAVGNKEHSGQARIIADGRMTVRGAGSSISAINGMALFEHLSLVVGDYRIDNVSPASFALNGEILSIKSLDLSGPQTKITVTGGAQLMKDMDFKFTGNANLSLLRMLFREVEFANGTAEVKLTVQGDWKNPDVIGDLRLKNGDIKIKDVPQKFSSLTGKITFSQNRIVADSLNGSMGGGTFSISGYAELATLALQDFSVKVSFENVSVHYPEGLSSTLSGALNYDGDTAEQSLTGDVAIKRALYDRRVDWKSMLVDIGKGLRQKKKSDIGWIGETQINIRFHGKDNILLQNNLAKIPLGIDMFLRGTVNQPQLLGRVEATKGTVYFRKNEFKIVHASADFVDPNRLNPILDIQAEIVVRQYRVTLSVTGTADRAVAVLLSDPPLPDADIIALLAVGRTSTELKGKENEVGMSEAYYFATGQLQDIVESRARSLTGLDRFQVDPYVNKQDVTVPRLTVGKEIVQDRVYLTYSSNVGSTLPEQIFRIENILSKHFSLEGVWDQEMSNIGADLKYRFEFK